MTTKTKTTYTAADEAFIRKALANYGTVFGLRLEALSLHERRAGNQTLSAMDRDEWTKILKSMERDGLLKSETGRAYTETSGKWLSTVRQVPIRRTVYRLAE